MKNIVKLPPKHRRFLKEYLKTGNIQKSAVAVGYDEFTGYGILKSPNFQSAFQIYLEKSGIDDNRIQSKLNELLDCKKLHSCDLLVKNKNGKLVVNENSNDFIEVPDNQSQVKALELAVKLKGHLQPDRAEANPINAITITIQDSHRNDRIDVTPIRGKQGNGKSPAEPKSAVLCNPGEDLPSSPTEKR